MLLRWLQASYASVCQAATGKEGVTTLIQTKAVTLVPLVLFSSILLGAADDLFSSIILGAAYEIPDPSCDREQTTTKTTTN